jgi:hypothetical protein
MTRRPRALPRRSRLAAAGAVALTLVAAGAATNAGSAAGPDGPALRLGRPAAKAAAASVDITSSAKKVVSSTGHRLRVQVVTVQDSTGTHVEVTAETRNRSEQHTWTFRVPRSAVSISTKGTGRIHLTSTRSAGYAVVRLTASPHGGSTHTTCQGHTATRTRHLSLSGTLLLNTRSSGKHAWGKVGSAHRRLHFSTHSKVTWVKPASFDCSNIAPTFPCRSMLLWMASGDSSAEDFQLMAGENHAGGSLVAGLRSVPLAKPAGATRSDTNSASDSSRVTLTDNGGSVTMAAAFGQGTATMTSDVPESTVVQKCTTGTKKISVEFWPGTYTNGTPPLSVPEQVFGALSVPDGSAAGLYRITLMG